MTESTGARGRLAQIIASRGGLAPPEAPFVIEHREALIYMLCEAAELEHGIMCQYLYAAFSLKQSEAEGLSQPKQKRSSAGASTSSTSPRRRCCTCRWCRTCCRPSARPRTCPGRTSRSPPATTRPGCTWRCCRSARSRCATSCSSSARRAWTSRTPTGWPRSRRPHPRPCPACRSARSSRAARTSPPSGTCTGPSRPGSRTWRRSSASRRCSSARRGRRPPSTTSAGPSWSR